MKAFFTTIAGSALIVGAWVSSSPAQIPMCPPEVASAKAMLNAKGSDAQASSRGMNTQASRGQDVQAARSQDVQAPRSQDVQAPRNLDVQAPRSQDVQAPRSQDVQAPRSQDVQAPRDRYAQTSPDRTAPGAPLSAQALVREAEAACQQGRTAEAREKALAALEIMKK